MATTYRQRAEYGREKKEHGQDFALKSVHQKIDATRSKALEKKKEVSFSNQRCKHGVTNANYCESCSHPKRAKLNEGRIPFRDKMSKRED
jgi:hypothetical protein